MGESAVHVRLVTVLVTWVSRIFLNGAENLILVDGALGVSQNAPPSIYGYTPDIYLSKNAKNIMVIGEAKTAGDLENNHTKDQFKAFMRKISEVKDSLFVVAVPWDMTVLARRFIEEQKKQLGGVVINTKVISEYDLVT
jgi:hypothetical protein